MRRHSPTTTRPDAGRPAPTLGAILGATMVPVAVLALLAVPELVLAAVLGASVAPTWRRVRRLLRRVSERPAPEARSGEQASPR